MPMTMTLEYISPERAAQMLKNAAKNRKISIGTVQCYASDIASGNWDENVSSAISFDDDGVLRDGQHRLSAIIAANKGIRSWICRGVAPDGLFDFNRPRSNSDQISITRPDLDAVYRSHKAISVVSALIKHETTNRQNRSKVSAKEISRYIDTHRTELDGFFFEMPQSTKAKISLSTVYIALYLAHIGGVKMSKIRAFYDVLGNGMTISPEDFPALAYRNYLLNTKGIHATDEEVKRCQYALKKYLTGSCSKQIRVPKDFIWDYPRSNES